MILETIDRLFEENRPKEAEKYMWQELEKAQAEHRTNDELVLWNELMGYYRQTSEVEPLHRVIERAVALAKEQAETGPILYATTLINAANASRALGELSAAQAYYETAEERYEGMIRDGALSARDLRVAALYNNISLLWQELGHAEKAEQYQLRALPIVEELQAGFEIAVTHANLANTYLLAKNYERMMAHAQKAKELFEARGTYDPHYAAALSVLGYGCLEKEDFTQAKGYFTEASHIVETTFGKNRQYERLQESLRLCEEREGRGKEEKSGLALARRYYETYGKPMLHERFADYENRIAVGLVGEGSDCYGYDDEISRDHDFGPDFCLWITEETDREIGDALRAAYAELPKSLDGVTRQTTAMGQGRRGVRCIHEFYEYFVGTSKPEEIDYASVPEYALAACTNGEVFRDDEGCFTAIRREIAQGYSEHWRLLKLAEDVAAVSQSGQYNYARMLKRGDGLTASLMLHDFARQVLRLWHHLHHVYTPHDKWLAASALRLPEGEKIVRALERLVTMEKEGVEEAMDRLMADIVAAMYAQGVISDMDHYVEHHRGELLFKASLADLSTDALVDRIARTEFEAFDKVKNEGGRASCQNNWPTFSVMRKSQYLTWNREMLTQYLYDFTREYERGHNLITEKYGRMMESTAPDRYAELQAHFPALSEQKKAVIEQIVAIQMNMVEAFAQEHPAVADNARSLHTYEDDPYNTSYETYLRGEISTYSDKMLQLYGKYVVTMVQNGDNIAYRTIENTAKLYGFRSLEEFEKGK